MMTSDGLLSVSFLTGNANPLLRTRALACGAEAFFLKPCEHSELVEIARQLKEISTKGNRVVMRTLVDRDYQPEIGLP